MQSRNEKRVNHGGNGLTQVHVKMAVKTECVGLCAFQDTVTWLDRYRISDHSGFTATSDVGWLTIGALTRENHLYLKT